MYKVQGQAGTVALLRPFVNTANANAMKAAIEPRRLTGL